MKREETDAANCSVGPWAGKKEVQLTELSDPGSVASGTEKGHKGETEEMGIGCKGQQAEHGYYNL